MSKIFTAAQIAEHALRQIGVYSVYDSGADESSMDITLERLDLLLGEMAGSFKLWWFVPSQQRIQLEGGVINYDLTSLLSSPLQFIETVYLLRDGKQSKLTQSHRSFIDAYSVDVLEGGSPEYIYIEKNDDPQITVLPAPIEGDELLFTGRKYAENVTQNNGNDAHEFPAAWQRALILQLAADIGCGPVKRLPENELNRLEKNANSSFVRLEYFQNRENVNTPRFTAPRDL